MTGPLTASRLSDDDAGLVRSLAYRLARLRGTHREWDDYYRGAQRLQSIGIAVPPQLRPFIFPLNWPRVTVDTIVQRQRVRSFSMPDDETASRMLREIWEANNMESQQVLNHTETRVQGHGFVAVGANPRDPDHPLITVESARNMIARVDPRDGRVECALRVYADQFAPGLAPEYATLYTPDYTLWLAKEHGRWTLTDRDDHHLGRTPVVQFLNRPRVGDWLGESEMADVIRPTDMAARAVLDMQIAMETHAVPGKWAIGVSDNQMIDPDTGRPATKIQQYFNSFTTTKNKDARFGQFAASDLTNFKTVIDMLSEQVSAVTGLPMRYFGQNTSNPAAEGAIRADEMRLVKNCEMKNAVDGDSWSRVMAIAYRIRTGRDLNENLVRCDWDDPNTPTYAQKSDAIQKLIAAGVLSREGAWDELGWSEARKDKEREYFRRQIAETYAPYLKEDAYGPDGEPDLATGGAQAGQTAPQAQ
ncbi:phage portal protein [Bifidobacterium samirii]|uniref:Phage portal protein gp6-like protein n=1 Tax=Bifidobacterium samirii TaxID=2306974 RepID=A0A430FUK0_9BIFI|nr:phage portal protein [Bifidobacterium samirii]RSX56764.1 phage portal protein gp6-like protein [Bifidobacterium samirii]